MNIAGNILFIIGALQMQRSTLNLVKSIICWALFLLIVNVSILELNPSLIQSAIIGFSTSVVINTIVYPIISFYIDIYYGDHNAE